MIIITHVNPLDSPPSILRRYIVLNDTHKPVNLLDLSSIAPYFLAFAENPQSKEDLDVVLEERFGNILDENLKASQNKYLNDVPVVYSDDVSDEHSDKMLSFDSIQPTRRDFRSLLNISIKSIKALSKLFRKVEEKPK